MKRKQQRRDEITVRMDVTLWREFVRDLYALRRCVSHDKGLYRLVGKWIAYFADRVPKGATGVVSVPGAADNYAAVVKLLRQYRLPSASALSAAVYYTMHGKPGQRTTTIDSETMAGARAAAAEMDAGGDDVPMGVEDQLSKKPRTK